MLSLSKLDGTILGVSALFNVFASVNARMEHKLHRRGGGAGNMFKNKTFYFHTCVI